MNTLFTTDKKSEQELMDEYNVEIKAQKESTDYFALIKSFYDDEEYAKFTNNEKNKMAFMVNRRMSIKHPIESAYFSKMGIDGYAIVDFWKDAITIQYRTYPGWLYTKATATAAPKDKNEERFVKFDIEVINTYLRRYDIEMKTLNELFKRFPTEVIDELESIEKLLTKSIIKDK
jgi:hypothetical protein